MAQVYKKIKLNKSFFALVDEETYVYLNQWKWTAIKSKGSNTHYAIRGQMINKKYVIIQMANQIIRTNKLVDHINRNGLDNRYCNLRIATYSQNCMNVPKKHINCSSKYKGVYFDKQSNKWRAVIRKDYKKIHIGSFYMERTAALAYNKKAIELFGDFAYLNEIKQIKNA